MSFQPLESSHGGLRAGRTPLPGGQRGAMTLFMVLVILTMMAGWAILSLRFNGLQAMVESSESRAAEVRQAADAGLEFALAWLSGHRWRLGDALPQVPLLDAEPGRDDNYHYTVALSLVRNPGGFIHVQAQASGPEDTHIQGRASRWLVQSELFNERLADDLPPLVIAGCLGGGIGATHLYPKAVDTDLDGLDDGWGDALHAGHDLLLEPDCIDLAGIDTEGGLATHPVDFNGSAWDYVFSIGKDEVKALSVMQQAQGLDADSVPSRSIYWVDSSNADGLLHGGDWQGRVGSQEHPVLLVFAAELGCPRLLGEPTIHGVVYYETTAVCATSGWGGAEIFGSVVHEGGVQVDGGSAILRHAEQAGAGGLRWPALGAAWLPGSWRDF